jgi:chromosome segregation ATPase
MIPTWAERCEKFGNEIVTNAMIQQAMQEEIDELRSKVDKMQDDIVSLTDDLFAERKECLKLEKELALQRLSDISQEFEQTELQTLVKSFFEDYLDVQEESDSGRVFNPIHVSCTRVMMTEPLAKLLVRMRELSGAKE